MTVDDFGSRIATVWSELRPATRGLVERALQSTGSTQSSRNFQYDARADLELSRFLAALDDRAAEHGCVSSGSFRGARVHRTRPVGADVAAPGRTECGGARQRESSRPEGDGGGRQEETHRGALHGG